MARPGKPYKRLAGADQATRAKPEARPTFHTVPRPANDNSGPFLRVWGQFLFGIVLVLAVAAALWALF